MTTRLVLALLCCTLSAKAASISVTNIAFSTASTWKFLRGTNEASLPDITAWRGTNFDDSAFADAPAPFWYGDVRSGGTHLTNNPTMQGNYSCIFLRRTFTVSDPTAVGGLKLDYFVDDGFIAWINGMEVYRENVAGDPDRFTLAANQAADPAPLVSASFAIPPGLLHAGSNWIAVQAFNTSLAGSSDFGFDLGLYTIIGETIPPTMVSYSPPAGTVSAFPQISVTFSEPVQGVTAGSLLLNNEQPAFGLSSAGATNFTFTFGTPGYGNVAVAWAASHGVKDLSLPPNPFNGTAPGTSWQYTFVDNIAPTIAGLFPISGIAVRSLAQIEITFSEEVNGVNAADLIINSLPATNVTRMAAGPYIFQFPSQPPGPVTVQFAGGHGIADQATVPNPFVATSWSYTVDPNAPLADLVINEINAANENGLTDEDTNAVDWVEIYNRGGTPADLAGWSLSDDPELPGLWVFPSVTINPGQYLVVFASGFDRPMPTGTNKMHTNFKLSEAGEFLGLYNSESPRVLISSLGASYPEQRTDHSYGNDSLGNLRYFSTPTPGGPNGSSTITGLTEPVHFSSSRGHYSQPFDLTLSCPTPASIIRFTTDGTIPSAINGTIYTAPVRVTNNLFLRASAFRANLLPSVAKTHSYLFTVSAANRSLPVLAINTAVSNMIGRYGILGMGGGSRASDNLFITNNPATDYHNPSAHGLAWEKPVSAELIYPADNSGFQIDCGIRVQGSDWQRPRTLPTHKFSYRLYFRGDYGAGRLEEPIFPLTQADSFDQVVVRAGFNDAGNPFIRDELTRRISHDMGQIASHGSFWTVYTNGGYAGYFNPTERVHEEFMQSYLGGGSEWDVVAPDFATGAGIQGVVDGDRNDFRNLLTNVWNGSLQPATNDAKYAFIGTRLNLVNFADYCLLNAYAAMGDWPANNWRAGRERVPGALWHFVVWDAEWANGFDTKTSTYDTFAQTGTGTLDAGLNSTSNSEIARLYQGLWRNREFRLLCADRIYKHFFNNGALTPARVTARMNEMRATMGSLFTVTDADFLGWPNDRIAPLMGQFNTYGLFGLSNTTHGYFASSNAPVLNQHGGRVAPGFSLTMTAPLGGTIYYTTNGDDPRVRFTGAVSNSAVVYAGPVALTTSQPIKARTLLDGTNWSAAADVVFDVGTLGVPLRLAEIMYNPTGGVVHEFIELMNIGSAPVALDRMYFDEGIEYTFAQGTSLAPGARLVLANNTAPAAFAAQYPGVTVHGYFNGSLNNGGERLTLRMPNGEIIFTVDYSDSAGWPTAADGSGRSLEVLNVFGGADDPSNWRSSPANGGSPGSVSALPASPAIVINEVLALNTNAVNNGGTFPDFIELHNPGGSPMNLTGWSLSDDGNARKFVFPSTPISAGGYVTVWCDATTNVSPGLHTGFTLDATGDSVFLYDPATNRVDAITLGLQIANRSVGRVGGQWVLTTPTTNAANVAATVGTQTALAINEWQASSAPGQNDWIEIYNSSGFPVSLQGVYLSSSNDVAQLTALSFLPPLGFAQIFADEGVGPNHVDFRLPAAGSTITLSDATATLVSSVTYSNAVEGLTRGRLPDGSGTFVDFPGSASPGTSNYVVAYTGPYVNEILARNEGVVINGGRYADYVELFNPGGLTFNLGGMSLSVEGQEPGQWTFPPGASINGGGYVVVWCDGGRPASSTAGNYNTGRWLDGESGGAYLFNASGQLVNSITFGFQIADKSIGISTGQWRLLTAPTPGTINSAAAALGPVTALRINEWMADPISGTDWFELYNTTNSPIDLSRLILTDDPSYAGTNEHRVAPLSFIGSNGFTRWIADNDAGQGRNHVGFSLDGGGDFLRLYATNGTTIIDSIAFAGQLPGISQGRLPDGTSTIASFPGSASPAAANYALLTEVVINEILTHTDPPLEDAVELRNVSGGTVNIGGWYLSDSQGNFKKYRIPDGTSIVAGGTMAFGATQFDTGPNAFNFNAAHGEEVWLSVADVGGNLSGYRTGTKFDAAANGVSFGRYVTSVGVDYPAMASRTLGTANSSPLIGPVILNEIMYHAPTAINGGEDEYVELLNVTGAPVPLYDPAAPTNTWQIEGIGYSFPQGFTLGAGSNVLVVNFDPANATALADFRSIYGVPATVPVLGPYPGRLDNGGEKIDLLKPDPPQPAGNPDTGFVPYILVDRVSYADTVPWPTGGTNGHADGGGFSLQRKTTSSYGNEPLNWVASTPTPGAANSMVVAPPVITGSPQGTNVFEGASPVLSVAATGTGPLGYQWRFNGNMLPDETNSTLQIGYAVVEASGAYDAIVSNPGGSALSASANVLVLVPPVIISPPVSVLVNTGTTATLTVAARGTPPLTYQWYQNGTILPGETGSSLTRVNITITNDGLYEVLVMSPAGMTSASARIDVRVAPVVVILPISQSVVAGSDVSFSAAISGNPGPFGYFWRRVNGNVQFTNVISNLRTNFVTINTTAAGFLLTNTMAQSNFACRLVITNVVNQSPGVLAQFTLTLLADTDGDGIPDVWESQYGFNPNVPGDALLDSDGDGMNNQAEYTAGTNPTNNLSFLSVNLSAAGPASAMINFGAISNRTYTLQYADQLPAWLKLTDVLARTNNRTEIVIDPAWVTNRFYRVVTPSQP